MISMPLSRLNADDIYRLRGQIQTEQGAEVDQAGGSEPYMRRMRAYTRPQPSGSRSYDERGSSMASSSMSSRMSRSMSSRVSRASRPGRSASPASNRQHAKDD